MGIHDLGAIGQFICSLVIVVTLMVLIYETRGAKQATLQANAFRPNRGTPPTNGRSRPDRWWRHRRVHHDRANTAEAAFAEVLNVVPATEQLSQAREVCEEVEVTHQAEPRDEHRVAGTAAGAIIGGVLGNQVGGGSGKKVATIVGLRRLRESQTP